VKRYGSYFSVASIPFVVSWKQLCDSGRCRGQHKRFVGRQADCRRSDISRILCRERRKMSPTVDCINQTIINTQRAGNALVGWGNRSRYTHRTIRTAAAAVTASALRTACRRLDVLDASETMALTRKVDPGYVPETATSRLHHLILSTDIFDNQHNILSHRLASPRSDCEFSLCTSLFLFCEREYLSS